MKQLEGNLAVHRLHLRRPGIRCNVIQPGRIETDLTATMSLTPRIKRMQKKTKSNTHLLRRSGQDRGDRVMALLLASDESSFITGTELVVDGGWFSSAPYLTDERSQDMLALMKTKDHSNRSAQSKGRQGRSSTNA